MDVCKNEIDAKFINYINNICMPYRLGSTLISDWIKYNPKNEHLFKLYKAKYKNMIINDADKTFRIFYNLE
jgi:hypothetical protein